MSDEGIFLEVEEDEEGEEITLKKILISLFLFVLGLLVEHVPFIKGMLTATPILTSFDLHKAVYLALYFVAFVISGKEVIKSAIKNIFKGEIFDEKFLMALASIGAIFIGQLGEAVGIMLFYNIGEFFQDYAVDKSRDSISALLDIRPDKAFVFRAGKLVEVRAEDVKVGEIIEVKPGERVSLDCVVVEGSSFMDTSALTGESVPRMAEAQCEVLAGFVNQEGVVRLKVTKPYSQSAISRILELTQKATEVKAKSEKFITKFAKIYTPIVCIGAVFVGLIIPFALKMISSEYFFEIGWNGWIYRALMFLVVSCPCALVISVPLSFFSAIGCASAGGILVKGSTFIEALSKARTAVFDKTGTLTKGTFCVTKIFTQTGVSEDELLALAAHSEYFSTHPISKSLKNSHFLRNSALGLDNSCCENCVKEDPFEKSGQGIKINLDGKAVMVGNEKLFLSEGVEIPKDVTERLKNEILGTIVHIAQDKKYLGSIVISDEIKEDSKDAILGLKKIGVKEIVMLTGDGATAANAIASNLGIKKVFSSLLPEDKAHIVKGIIDEGKAKKSFGSVIFVGDGINDSPVLATADVGVAMGALGSDAAIEAADVVIMDDKPSRLPLAIKLSKKAMLIVKENIVFSLLIKGLIMGLGAFGITNLWFAVFGDVGVCFLAILNSLRIQNAGSLLLPASRRPKQNHIL
ncbi:heavy metal translocating P-type ATPase [Treponema pectinovorum]|uniref:heavy metal translocating P-type ATPase n=1 Tax=Treponema pectinovorum TaxID=164 RepID=UPI0011CBD2C9|nr:heavy metal translocating P-type ATPase [Treponema pectinovorum]